MSSSGVRISLQFCFGLWNSSFLLFRALASEDSIVIDFSVVFFLGVYILVLGAQCRGLHFFGFRGLVYTG